MRPWKYLKYDKHFSLILFVSVCQNILIKKKIVKDAQLWYATQILICREWKSTINGYPIPKINCSIRRPRNFLFKFTFGKLTSGGIKKINPIKEKKSCRLVETFFVLHIQLVGGILYVFCSLFIIWFQEQKKKCRLFIEGFCNYTS